LGPVLVSVLQERGEREREREGERARERERERERVRTTHLGDPICDTAWPGQARNGDGHRLAA